MRQEYSALSRRILCKILNLAKAAIDWCDLQTLSNMRQESHLERIQDRLDAQDDRLELIESGMRYLCGTNLPHMDHDDEDAPRRMLKQVCILSVVR